MNETLPLFTVTEAAMRPASPERRCFYCHQPIGAFHQPECVTIRKKVKIRMVVEFEVDEPFRWDKEQIEFNRNDGSWCANNVIRELQEFTGDFDDDEDVIPAESKPCLCNAAKFECLDDSGEPYLSEN